MVQNLCCRMQRASPTHLICFSSLIRHGCLAFLFIQPPQKLLAHLHGGPQLCLQLLGFFSERVAKDSPGGLCPIAICQGEAQTLDLPFFLLVWSLPDGLQLLILLLQLFLQPLDLLEQANSQNTFSCPFPDR